jgi:hypothetical protein
MPGSHLPDPLPRSAEEVERYLRQHRPPQMAALALPDEFVVPCSGLSIANVPATIARILGGQASSMEPPLPEALWADLASGVRRVVWLILDAVAWQPFAGMLVEEPELGRAWLGREGRLLPITSVLPTTTTSALITLWTGRSPAQHGLVGHTMFLREFGVLADMLKLGPIDSPPRDQLIERGLDLPTFLPAPGLAEVLARQGIVTRSLINVDLAQTGFSRLSFRGVTEVIGFVTAADMWVRMRETLAAWHDEVLLLVGYLSDFDGIGHVEGPGSDAWRAVMRALAFSLENEFRRRLGTREREGTLLLVTADHGQLVDACPSIALCDHPALWKELMMPPSGSPRAAYLYASKGRVEAARHYLRDRFHDAFAVLDSLAALEGGLFGSEPTAESAYRLGDLIVAGRDNYLLDSGLREFQPVGMHAGLNPQEMLVPLLLSRLD